MVFSDSSPVSGTPDVFGTKDLTSGPTPISEELQKQEQEITTNIDQLLRFSDLMARKGILDSEDRYHLNHPNLPLSPYLGWSRRRADLGERLYKYLRIHDQDRILNFNDHTCQRKEYSKEIWDEVLDQHSDLVTNKDEELDRYFVFCDPRLIPQGKLIVDTTQFTPEQLEQMEFVDNIDSISTFDLESLNVQAVWLVRQLETKSNS